MNTFILSLVLAGTTLVSGQWIGSSMEEAALTPGSSPRFTSILSVRSSEEEHLKSPLAHHLPHSSSFFASNPETALGRRQQDESRPVTVYRNSRRTSGPSATRRKQQAPRPSRYEYSSRLPDTSGFVSFPFYRTRLVAPENKKLYRKPQKLTAAAREQESGRVSSNPPEAIPAESVKPVEFLPPKKYNPKMFKKHHVIKPYVNPNLERETERETLLTPDKHLGNDMLYYHENRGGVVAPFPPGNGVEDDPNADFVLIK